MNERDVTFLQMENVTFLDFFMLSWKISCKRETNRSSGEQGNRFRHRPPLKLATAPLASRDERPVKYVYSDQLIQ